MVSSINGTVSCNYTITQTWFVSGKQF